MACFKLLNASSGLDPDALQSQRCTTSCVCICVYWAPSSLLPLLPCFHNPQPHRAPVADMVIDASGSYVATGSADRTIRVTDLAGGFATHHLTGHGCARACSCTHACVRTYAHTCTHNSSCQPHQMLQNTAVHCHCLPLPSSNPHHTTPRLCTSC